ncbi:MAG: hypothetical protein ACRDQ5_21400 [Sciscionella sp.]
MSQVVTEPKNYLPVVVTEQDLAKAREILDRFSRAQSVNSDSEACASLRALAQAGDIQGSPTWAHSDQRWFLLCTDNVAETGKMGTDRPWRWLTAVADQASAQGDYKLVGIISLFTVHWLTNLAPKLSMAAEAATRLAKDVDPSIRAELFSICLRALHKMNPDDYIIYDADNPNDPTKCITVRTVTFACAMEAAKVKDLLDSELATAITRLLGRVS